MKRDQSWNRDRRVMLDVCASERLSVYEPSRICRWAGSRAEGVCVSICGNERLRALGLCAMPDVIIEVVTPPAFSQAGHAQEVWRANAKARALRIARTLSARGVDCTLRLGTVGHYAHQYRSGQRVGVPA